MTYHKELHHFNTVASVFIEFLLGESHYGIMKDGINPHSLLTLVSKFIGIKIN